MKRPPAVQAEDLRVTINGNRYEYPETTAPILVDPGPTTVMIAVRGKPRVTRQVQLAPRQSLTINIPPADDR